MFEKLLQKLVALLKSKNVEVKKEDLELELKSELSEFESKIKEAAADNPVIKSIIEQNNILIQQVKDLQNAIVDEKKFRDEASKNAKEQAEREHEKKIAEALQKALTDKKITEAEKADWESKLKKDFDWANGDLNKLPVKKEMADNEGQKKQTGENQDEYKAKVESAKTLLEESFKI